MKSNPHTAFSHVSFGGANRILIHNLMVGDLCWDDFETIQIQVFIVTQIMYIQETQRKA